MLFLADRGTGQPAWPGIHHNGGTLSGGSFVVLGRSGLSIFEMASGG